MRQYASDALIVPIRRSAWRVFFVALIPSATLIVALVFGAVPLASITWSKIVPDFLAPVLFFWCINRSALVPILLVFVLGMAADIMHNAPLGVYTLSYMVLAIVTKAMGPQLANQGLLLNWGVFSLTILGFGTIKFITSMVGTPGVLGPPPLSTVLQLMQLILTTIAVYPVVHLILTIIHEISQGSRELGPVKA